MDTRQKVWREEEQRLLERWNAATGRFRDAQAALSKPAPAGVPQEALTNAAATARTELDHMRKQVARLKAEFSSGKRY
jgi:hypothetical protein